MSTTSGAAVSDASGLLNTNMYLFIGKTTAWSDDTAPPSPTDAVANTHYEHWRDMIAAKRITSADVSHVIPRKNWTNNTSYFAYTHNEGNLFSQNFYVMTDEFNVYKCLANNDTTSGGAVQHCKTNWNGDQYIDEMVMVKFRFSQVIKFVTPNYIPVDTMEMVFPNTNDGSPSINLMLKMGSEIVMGIEVVGLTTRGSGYLGEVGTLSGSPSNISNNSGLVWF